MAVVAESGAAVHSVLGLTVLAVPHRVFVLHTAKLFDGESPPPFEPNNFSVGLCGRIDAEESGQVGEEVFVGLFDGGGP